VARAIARGLFLLLWAGGLSSGTPAQDAYSRFERITPRQGLPASMIRTLLQDRYGFIWIGTEDGLCRYDGASFVTWRSQHRNPASLTENLATCLLEDRSGDMWVGTFSGLNRLNAGTGKVRRYTHRPDDLRSLSHNYVLSLCLDQAGAIWVGTRDGGLNRFDPATGTFTRFRHDPARPDSLAADKIPAVIEDRQGRLWVATDGGGLELLDRATGHFRHHRHDPRDPASLPSDRVHTLHEDRSGRLWVGTVDQGLAWFDRSSSRFIRYPVGEAGGLSDAYVRRIAEDARGRLWIATNDGGLNCLDPATGRVAVYRHHTEDPHSLSHFQVFDVLVDRSGMLWAGTFDGISKLDLRDKPFRAVRRLPGVPDGLSDNSVSAVLEDRFGGVWIGTDRGGLNYYDPAGGRFRHFLPGRRDSAGLTSECITSLLEDPDGSLWVGTYTGLCRLDLARSRFTPVAESPPRPDGLPEALVQALLRDRQGVLWAGSLHGLYRVDAAGRATLAELGPADDPAKPSYDSVFSLAEDRQGRLWIGTSDRGIRVMAPGRSGSRSYRKNPSNPRSLASDVIFALLETRDGTMWIGTPGGLHRYEAGSDDFSVFTTEDGLPNDNVVGILEDDWGQLWLSTLRGICRFDPRRRTCRNYDTRDGLSGNDCFQGAFHRGRSGRFYVGSTGGLTIFRPEDARAERPLPPVVLTSLKVANVDRPVAGALAGLRELTLDYRHKSLSFEFTTLDFRAPERIRYSYRLRDFDKDWVPAGERRLAAYTNLDPGEYRFQARAAGPHGRWATPGVNLLVRIPPPFWQTAWFRVVAVLCFIGLSNLLVVAVRKGYRMAAQWRKSRFISHYRVLHKVGQGGMGTVYRVKDLSSGRTCALKIMNENLMAVEADRKRFLEESFICETLGHPNVIQVFEKGEVETTLYSTMEDYDGQTLQELLRKSRPTVTAALQLSRTLFEILHEIHERGVIHRDLKPGNIMLAKHLELDRTPLPGGSSDGLRAGIRILDFGLARFTYSQTLTQTGAIVGSLHYMPPEYLRGTRGRSPACDHYSLGVILYEMLTGRLPYAGNELWETVFAIAGGNYPSPAEIRPEVPPALSDFVVRLIRADADQRLSDYQEIMAGFEALRPQG